MKHYSAFILLLLVPVPLLAQMRVPGLQKSTELNEEQKRFYEGRRVFSLEFRGNQHFTSETLLGFMKTQVGERYYAEQLEDDIDRLKLFGLSRRGYLKASVDAAEIEDTIKGLRIVLPIREGALYRWGAITAEGSAVFSQEEALQIVGLKSGEIADGYGLQQGFSKLAKLYRDRGYFQFNLGFIPDFKLTSPADEEGVVDFALDVEEGELFLINTIRFEGNSNTTDRALRRRLLIQEGDIYDESLLQESLSRLNSLGLFEKLTLEDVALNTNGNKGRVDIPNNGRVDITIRLKEKGRDTDR